MSDHIEINVTEDERTIQDIILRSGKPTTIQQIADTIQKPYDHVELIVRMLGKKFGDKLVWGRSDDDKITVQYVTGPHFTRFRAPQ